MKLTIERAALLRSLGHVQRVVERRNTIPILSNVLLKAKGDELALTATDMDLEIVETVAAEVARAGAATAPAHTLYDIVRKLPDGSQVEIDGGDGGMITLRSGRSQFKLGCLPVEDFPQMSGTDVSHSFTVAAGDLRTLIDRSRFAISTEETRYYLNGIYLHAAKARTGGSDIPVLRAVATDGHRLARVEMPLPAGAEGIPGVIVPRKTVGEIRNLIDEAASGIEVAMSETKIRFTLDGITLTSKLIDGTYPDYERVIPKDIKLTATASAPALRDAVNRVSILADKNANNRVELLFAEDKITLTAEGDYGRYDDSLSATISGEDAAMTAAFNAKHLLDALGPLTGDAMLRLSGSTAPMLVEPLGGTYRAVMVALRV
jgi:DNA polymerase-3 subunit beta